MVAIQQKIDFDAINLAVKNSVILAKTFSFDSKCLPTVAEIRREVLLEDDWDLFNANRSSYTFCVRDQYVVKNFSILTHELMLEIKFLVTDKLNLNLVELGCGLGWFSYWLKKYGVSVLKAVDNKTWNGRDFRWEGILNHVTIEDAVECVVGFENVDVVFLLSWPYMDDLAHRIWQALKPAQRLLYIGECNGGCTADEVFFDSVEGHNEVGLENIISFWGIHDRGILYRK